jgi:hypothetical protein
LPLKDDAVDDRVLDHLDDQVAGLGTQDLGIGEQLGGVKLAQGLVELIAVERLAGPQRDVGKDRLRLEPLISADGDRPYDLRFWVGATFCCSGTFGTGWAGAGAWFCGLPG